jgi:hypothetical protein
MIAKCGCSSVVERDLPKVDVVGSIPITRSIFRQKFEGGKVLSRCRNCGAALLNGAKVCPHCQWEVVAVGPLSLWSKSVRFIQLAALWLGAGLMMVLAIDHQVQFPTSVAFFGFALAAVFLIPPVRAAISPYFTLGPWRTAIAVALTAGFGVGIIGSDEQRVAEADAAAKGFQSSAELARASQLGFVSRDQLVAHDKAEAEKAAAEMKRKKEQAELARVAAAKAKEAEEAACKTNLQCWGEKHRAYASAYCQKFVERLAKYQHEWTDGWLEPKFSHFRWKDQSQGHVTYIGDKIKFQNGFGAWQFHVYSCDFDPVTNRVLDVAAAPGRM